MSRGRASSRGPGGRFEFDDAVLGVLKRTPAVQRTLEHTVEQVAAEAQRIARDEAYESGDYADGIQPQVGLGEHGLEGRVIGRDWKSHLVEFGTDRVDGKHVLYRALESQCSGRVERHDR